MSKAKKPTIDADFQLKIGDRQVPISVAVPDYDVAAVELIPVYQAITDKVVSNNAQESEANGKAISCRAGCGSCCNQMVPVTLLEAEHLSKVVKRMPEPKQSRVRQRFKAIEEKMQTTGLAMLLFLMMGTPIVLNVRVPHDCLGRYCLIMQRLMSPSGMTEVMMLMYLYNLHSMKKAIPYLQA